MIAESQEDKLYRKQNKKNINYKKPKKFSDQDRSRAFLEIYSRVRESEFPEESFSSLNKSDDFSAFDFKFSQIQKYSNLVLMGEVEGDYSGVEIFLKEEIAVKQSKMQWGVKGAQIRSRQERKKERMNKYNIDDRSRTSARVPTVHREMEDKDFFRAEFALKKTNVARNSPHPNRQRRKEIRYESSIKKSMRDEYRVLRQDAKDEKRRNKQERRADRLEKARDNIYRNNSTESEASRFAYSTESLNFSNSTSPLYSTESKNNNLEDHEWWRDGFTPWSNSDIFTSDLDFLDKMQMFVTHRLGDKAGKGFDVIRSMFDRVGDMLPRAAAEVKKSKGKYDAKEDRLDAGNPALNKGDGGCCPSPSGVEKDKYFLNTMIFLYQVTLSQTPFEYSAACYQYLSAVDQHSFSDRIQVSAWAAGLAHVYSLAFNKKKVTKAKKKIRALFGTESKTLDQDGFLEQMHDFFRMVFSSEIVDQLRKMLLSIASYKLFSKDVSDKLKAVFGPAKKMTVIEFIDNMFSSLMVLLRIKDSVDDGVPIFDALFAKDPISVSVRDAERLLLYQDRLYTGLPVEGMMCRSEFLAKIEPLMKFLNSANKKLNPLTNKIDLTSLCLRLEAAYSSVMSTITNKMRATPFGIVVHGDPEVGKSKVVPYCCYLWSEVKGRKFDDSQIFPVQPDSEFFDGHNPASQPFLFFSEIGNIAEQLAKNMGDMRSKIFCTLCDSLPYLLNFSGVPDKGRFYAMPEMVIGDSNDSHFNVEHTVSNSAAVFRRFWFLCVMVRPDCRKADGMCGVDREKVKALGLRPMEIYTFGLEARHPTSAKTFESQFLMTNRKEDDIYRLEKVLRKLMEEHVRHEAEMLQTFGNTSAYEGYGQKYTTESNDLDLPVEDEEVEVVAPSAVRRWISSVTEVLSDSFFAFNKLVTLRVLMHATEKIVPHPVKEDISFSTIMCALSLFIILPLPVALLFFNTLCFFLVFDYRFFVISQLRDGVREEYEAEKLRLVGVKDRLLYLCDAGDYNYNPLHSDFWNRNNRVLQGISLLLGGFAIYYALSSSDDEDEVDPNDFHSESHTEFRMISPINEKLNLMEESFHCGNSYERVPNKKLPEAWNVREVFSQSLATNGVHSLYESIRRNCRRVVVSGTHNVETYIFGLCEDYALINTHAFGKSDEAIIRISTTGSIDPDVNTVWITSKVTSFDRVDIGNDASIVRLNGMRFQDKVKHFSDGSHIPVSCEAVMSGQKVRAFYKQCNFELPDENVGTVIIDKFFIYDWASHGYGKCGLPLVILRDSAACIAGIHTGGARAPGVTRCFATLISSVDIRKGLSRLSEQRIFIPAVSESKVLSSFDVEAPIPKSPFFYEVMHGVKYYGKVKGHVLVNNKSRLKRTPYFDQVQEALFNKFSFISQKNFRPPLMKPQGRNENYKSPWNVGLRQMNRQKACLDIRILGNISEQLTSRFITGLTEKGVKSLSPLTIHSAINGAKGDYFIKRMNASTSAGFGWGGTKGKYLPIVLEEAGFVMREPVEELKEKIASAIECYQRGESANFVYEAKLKDEPREESKVLAGKTRIFYMSPVEAVVLARMFLSPFYSLMVEFGEIFCTSIGMNPHGDADAFYRSLIDFSNLVMEGDYKWYDINIPPDIKNTAHTIIVNVLRHFGYAEEAIKVVIGLLSDDLFPLVLMNMDLFEVFGLQPSGKYATAESNSLYGLILLMYAWYCHEVLGDMSFFEHVLPRTFGDDLLASVKKSVSSLFNNNYYQDFCERVYFMGYTSASKTETMLDFVDPADMTFLKRTFRYDEKHDSYVAPLDMESICKALTWYIPSVHMRVEDQLADTCVSALWELFFHVDEGDWWFFRELFCGYLNEHFGTPLDEISSRFPLYADIEARVF